MSELWMLRCGDAAMLLSGARTRWSRNALEERSEDISLRLFAVSAMERLASRRRLPCPCHASSVTTKSEPHRRERSLEPVQSADGSLDSNTNLRLHCPQRLLLLRCNDARDANDARCWRLCAPAASAARPALQKQNTEQADTD